MSDARRRLLPVLAVVAFATALTAPMLFAGQILHFRDFGSFYRPVKTLCLERMLAGELPIWMPEWNCGTPVHGEMVHALLYPGNLLLLLAGGATGWGLYFAFHVVLAGLSARALARRLGATADGALLAGIAFAGSGYLVAQMNHVPYLTAAAWSPLVLLLGLSAAAGRRAALPLLAAVFAAAALAGEPFTLLLTIGLLLVLVLAGVGGARRVPALLRIALAGAVALLLASPALLPALETLSGTLRAGGFAPAEDGFGSLHPFRLGTLLVPELLGRLQETFELDHEFLGRSFTIPPPILLGAHLGAVTLVLLLLAPFRRSRAALALGIVAAVAAVLSLGTYVGVSPLLAKVVPGLSVFRYPHKYWFLTTLAAAPVAGLAADRVPRAGAILAGIGAVLAVLLGAAAGRIGAGIAGAVPFALAAAAIRAPARARVRLLTAVLAAELLFFGIRLDVTVDQDDLDPDRGLGGRLATYDPGPLFVEIGFGRDEPRRAVDLSPPLARSLVPLTGLPHGFTYSFGYDPVEPIGRLYYYFHSAKLAAPSVQRPAFDRLLRLVGTTHLVTRSDLGGEPGMRFLFEGELGIRAYEIEGGAPPARLYGDARVVEGLGAAQRMLVDPGYDPFRVLMLEGGADPGPGGAPRGSAEVVGRTSRGVTVSARSDRAAWLFLAETMAPGWTATVNGRPAEIQRAFLAFRAVRVPAGVSRVTFRYEPTWLRVAPWTFGMGVLLLLGLAGYARMGRRRPTAPPSA